MANCTPSHGGHWMKIWTGRLDTDATSPSAMLLVASLNKPKTEKTKWNSTLICETRLLQASNHGSYHFGLCAALNAHNKTCSPFLVEILCDIHLTRSDAFVSANSRSEKSLVSDTDCPCTETRLS